eukprot:tig00000093_g3657.t1
MQLEPLKPFEPSARRARFFAAAGERQNAADARASVSRASRRIDVAFMLQRTGDVVPLVDIRPPIELPSIELPQVHVPALSEVLPHEVQLMRNGTWSPPKVELPFLNDIRAALGRPFNDLVAFADKSKLIGIASVILLAVNAGARILEWQELRKHNEILSYQAQAIGALIERLDATIKGAAGITADGPPPGPLSLHTAPAPAGAGADRGAPGRSTPFDASDAALF